MGVTLRKFGLAVLLLCPLAALGQFQGYVGLQTVQTPVVLNSSTTGRHVVNQNIGASYHTITYCLSTPATAVQLIVEQSADGQAAHFTQVSPVSEFPWQAINGNNCGTIRVGGYYALLAVNVLLLTDGNISIWYTGTAGPTDLYAPAVNSSGGTSPIECDQTLVLTALAPGGFYTLVPASPNQGIYVCGGIVSFDGATTPGNVILEVGVPLCGLARINIPAKPNGRPPPLTQGTIIWFTYITPSTPQLFPLNSATGTLRIPPTSASGTSLCLSIGSVTANTAITLSFAQF